jgi:SEC-C motif-containing protein
VAPTRNHWLYRQSQFKAYFLDDQNQEQIHHELSTFIFEENGSWFYSDGD